MGIGFSVWRTGVLGLADRTLCLEDLGLADGVLGLEDRGSGSDWPGVRFLCPADWGLGVWWIVVLGLVDRDPGSGGPGPGSGKR